jgi:Restriction endonuclease
MVQIYSDGLACLVECKDQRANIPIDPVAKLRNQMLRRPVGIVGLVFHTGGFTNAVKILARYSANQVILLWNGIDIECALGNQEMRAGLVKKYRYCVERALPDYSLELEDLS